MIKNSTDLSGKTKEENLDALSIINDVSSEFGIPFFIIGATARDIILHGHGIATTRATVDVDLGVMVSNWEEYQKLKGGLIKTGVFIETHEYHRLIFNSVTPIDMIPFGPISESNDSISWPPDNEPTLSIIGFKEVYDNSQFATLRSKPMLKVRIAGLAGLAILKLISWDERYPERRKDAQDLLLMMREYLDAGNVDRSMNEELGQTDEDFDFYHASARLLGQDMASICNPDTLRVVRNIIMKETDESGSIHLLSDMMGSGQLLGIDLDRILALLTELRTGLLGRPSN